MLRIHQTSSAAAAKSYYASGLVSEGGYYAKEGGNGIWFGEGAERLSLHGEANALQFEQLCDNIRPDTLGRLNPRRDHDRRVGYDFLFTAPKGVSLVSEVLGDVRVLPILQKAVRETMALIEGEVMVRVRKGGVVATRQTGNMVYCEFTHHSSRPTLVPGESQLKSDPMLHCHCYAICTSWDNVESAFKAADFSRIKADAVYFESIYHSKLALGLREIGYRIEVRDYGFEIAGIGAANLKRFSRRAAEIGILAERLGIGADARAKDQLAARSRKGKQPNLDLKAQLEEWKSRFDYEDLNLETGLGTLTDMNARKAVSLAIAGAFERKSVVQVRRLVADALQTSLGICGVEEIEAALATRDDLIFADWNGSSHCTTREVLGEERAILEFLKRSRGSVAALNPWYICRDQGLDQYQRRAVESILRSSDQLIVVEGKAGTGKSSMMRSAIDALIANGVPAVYTFAPTSQAAHEVLRNEGFNSETVQQLLKNTELQARLETGCCLWIDEAGLLSSKDTNELLKIADQHGARVIMGGDRSQHHSVERGDILRLVAGSGLVEVCQTKTIYRQRKEAYRDAIQRISEGDVIGAFEQLDHMGVIREVDDFAEQLSMIADDYVGSLKRYRSVIAVSPTHFEGGLLTGAIRAKLRESGDLTIGGTEIPVFRNRNLTLAERSQQRFFNVGEILRFHQNAKGGFRRGETWEIDRIDENGIHLLRLGQTRSAILVPEAAAHFEVCRKESIEVAVGDKLRLLANMKSLDGKRLFNGAVHELTAWGKEGEMILDGRHRVRSDCGLLGYGFVTTSMASQGRTADKVIISQSSSSRGASSLEQFYVSISRGRDDISIWCSSKADLLDFIVRSDQRILASEFQRDAEFLGEKSELESWIGCEHVAELQSSEQRTA